MKSIRNVLPMSKIKRQFMGALARPSSYLDALFQFRSDVDAINLATHSHANEVKKYLRGEASLVEPHWLFDEDYFLDQISGQNLRGNPPVIAFFEQWHSLGADPHPMFSVEYYETLNPDVASRKINPLAHFIRFGMREGRDPNFLFDSNWYLSRYPDVAKAGQIAFEHYCLHGAKEQRNPSELFDTSYFRDAVEGGAELVNPLEHYFRLGVDDRPSPTPLLNFQMLRAQGVESGTDVVLQFLIGGHQLNPNQYFDSSYYIDKMELSETDNPLLHYLSQPVDAKTIQDPHPYFSASDYLKDYPEVAPVNPLLHYLRWGRKEGRQVKHNMSATQIKMFDEASRFEPSLRLPKPGSYSFRSVPVPNPDTHVYKLVKSALSEASGECDVLLLLSGYRMGGAELEALHFISALAHNTNKKIVVLTTDAVPAHAKHWWPELTSVEYVSLSEDPRYCRKSRLEALSRLVSAFSPEEIWNCNSWVGWEFYSSYGASLSNSIDLSAFLFCYDYDVSQRPVGYAVDYFQDTIAYLKSVHVDNRRFIDTLIEDFGVPVRLSDKLKLIYQPSKSHARCVPERLIRQNLEGKHRKPRVLWAGRFARQKNPELLFEIARLLPEVEFVVAGAGKKAAARDYEISKNIKFHGSYDEFFDLPLETFGLYLHTALWEGLPNVIIDVASSGIPAVVGSVGGISELLTPESSWLVEAIDEAEAFVRAIEDAINNPDVAIEKRDLALQKVGRQHSEESYLNSLIEQRIVGN